MSSTRRRLLIGAATAVALPALGQSAPRVVATTGMIADTARAIGGGTVTALMGPGVDPHAYRQTRTDIAALTQADLVLWNGLYLEAQLEAFLGALAARTRVVAVAESVPRDLRIGHDDYADREDPHVWMVPELWDFAAIAIGEALEAANAGAAGLPRVRSGLSALGTYAAEVLATVPEAHRVLVTAHDAFNYFGRAYGFAVEGIQGISTESEAGLRRIEELVDLIVARKLPAVFVESSVSDRNVRALVEGARARGHDVSIGGELFSDAMGPEGTYEGTYRGMIDHNATVIARALGGRAPEAGMNGALNV